MRTALLQVISASALLLSLAACGTDEAFESLDDLPAWEAEEVVRIGSEEASVTAFSRVSDVLQVDSTLYVVEAASGQVRAFSTSGQPLFQFGGRGQGPGELQAPSAIGLTDGLLSVRDGQGQRLEVYSPEGTPVESHRFATEGDSLGERLQPFALLAEGPLVAGPARISVPAALRGSVRHADFSVVSDQGEVQQRIYRQPMVEGDFFQARLPSGPQMFGAHPIPQSPLVEVAASGDGLLVVDRTTWDGTSEPTFRLRRFSASGEVQFDHSIPYEPAPANDWLGRHLESMNPSAGIDPDPGMREALEEGMAPRDYLPPVDRLVSGADGTIWLRRVLDSGAVWQVLDSSGEPLARVALPEEFELLHASDEVVWGSQRYPRRTSSRRLPALSVRFF